MKPGVIIQPLLFLLADDLTGALDSAVKFAARGLRATVRLAPSGRETIDPEVDIAGFDLDSRRLPPSEAAEAVRRAVRTIGITPGDRLFHKIDSTLRGNLESEISALTGAVRRFALVAPALPSEGRTVSGGRVYLRGEPLGRALAALEPGRPVPDDDLLGRLGAGSGLPTYLIDRERLAGGRAAVVEFVREKQRSGLCVLIGDAETDADLGTLASAAWEVDAGAVLAGSSGVAAAAARMLRPVPAAVPAAPRCERIVLVCGSGSNAAAKQWGRLAESGTAVCLDLGDSGAGEFDLSKPAGLRLPSGPAGGDREPLLAAARQIAAWDPEALVVVGGDTCRGLADRLGVEELTPTREIVPGCPLSFIGGGRLGGRRLVTKAGAFGSPETLVEILRKLRTGGG